MNPVTTIIIVTHEPAIAEHVHLRLHMLDGLIDRIDVSANEAN